MLNVVEQANTAAQQLNWSLVIQCLQTLPLGIRDRQNPTNQDTELVTLSDRDLAQVSNLALDVLKAGDFQERWEIAKIIPKLGERAITPLIEILQDEEADLELRWFVIRILGGFADPIIITTLLDFLKTSEDAELSTMAAATLSSVGEQAIEALSSLLLVPESRFLATKALAQIRHPQTITPLLSVVNDADAAVRAMAIEALSSFHDPRIPAILIEALQDLTATVRKEAVIGLGLRALGQELDLINRLKPLLYDFNEDVCQQAGIALGRLGTEAAVQALFEVLQSAATPLRLQLDLIRVLGWVETTTSLDCLQQALKISTVDTALEIVRVLGRITQSNLKTKAAQILIELLNSQQPAVQSNLVKQAIAQSWGELGEVVAVEALLGLLADPAMSVRLHAIAALKNFPNSYQQLEQLATQEQLTPALKAGIAIALGEW
ncbi:MAG: HEAT repeat domain-containing protein [Coleofasciculaceae cyanobacterium]